MNPEEAKPARNSGPAETLARGDRILLTGATGFIGSHVLEALTAAGFRVVALVRRSADASFVRGLGAEVRYGDLRDRASLREAAVGCRQVVHTAGLAKDWGARHDFEETNVVGTLNVLDACAHHGIEHAVVTGSISSYGEEDSENVKDETSPSLPHYPYFLDSIFPSALNYYRESKSAATRAAEAYALEHRLNLTVLEPAWTFGEREFGTGFHAYLKAVQNGARWMPGSARNWFHVVYAGDLARAYVLACQQRRQGVERLIIGYPEPCLMSKLFALLCEAADLKPPRLLRKWSLYPAAFSMELAYTLAGSREPPPLTRGRLNTFYDSIRYSTSKAKAVLSFECGHPIEDAVRRTVGWYKQNHYL